MAPINYSENVITLLADIVLFNYHFVLSDLFGIVIIAVCIIVPVIMKFK